MRRLDSGQTESFSIHQVAERNKHDLANIDSDYDRFERQMLDEFFEFLKSRQNHQWVHWNMRDINYGFAALEHRHKVLGGTPTTIHESQRFDLSRLLVEIYGVGYIAHPRLENLLEKNSIGRIQFLTGAEEATAFIEKNYVALHQSTLRKVDVIANIAGRAHDRTLKTNASWWDLHGGSLKGAAEWLTAHWVWALVVGIATMVSALVALYHA